MTTAFQWIFDNAASITIDRRAVVAQTQTRDQTVRATSRGGQIWRFDVTMPEGLPWDQNRQYLESLDHLDRYTPTPVQINNPNYSSWLLAYQGDAATRSGWSGSWTQGSTQLTLTSAPTATQYRLRANDMIQLGSGHVYSVVSDVAAGVTAVTLNRPVVDATGSGSLAIGPDVIWTVICTTLPTYRVMRRNQIGWSGSFHFVESMV
jgi:hypothetical protein